MKNRLRSGLGLLAFAQLAVVQPGMADDDIDSLLGPSEAPAAAAAQAPASAPAPASAQTPAPAAAEAAAPAAAAEPAAAASAAAPAAAATTEASSGTTAAAGRSVKNRLTEEIVVTAEKREQSLQEVPATVQAFSGQLLDAKGVSDVKDLQLVTPGLQYDSMASYSIIYIRGVGGDAYQAGIDSSVATYVDGLYLPFTFSAAQGLGDVQQIEVLKGPQGTLYGRNAIAGAITVKLKEPTKDFTASVLAETGSQDNVKFKLSASGPVPFTKLWRDENTLSYSFSVLYQDHQAFDIYYPDPSQKYHSYMNAGYRAALKWEPFGQTSIQASHLELKNQDADSVVTVLLKAFPAFQNVLTSHNVPHESGIGTYSGVFGRTRLDVVSVDSKDIPWFDSKFIYGHSGAHSNILFDYDGAPEAVLDISAVPNTEFSTSYELTLTSNPEKTPDWLEWIGGLYYEDTTKTGHYPVTVDALATVLNIPGSAQGLSICNSLLTPLGLDCSATPVGNQNPLAQARLGSGFNNKARSAYGQITAHLNEQLSAVLGGRASSETAKLLYSTVEARLQTPGGVNSPDCTNYCTNDQGYSTLISFNQQVHTWASFTPNAGLNYKPFDGTMLYYKYSEAFKSGNYNGLNLNKPPTRVEPEAASSNEIGIKSENLLSDRSLKTNAAVFTTTVTNAQVQTLSLLAGGVTSLQNAGAYTVRGAEAEVNWNATDALVFNGSAVWLHGRYDQFIGRQEDPAIGLNRENIDFTGKHTVRTPTWTATSSVSYSFPFFFNLDGEATTDVYYTSGYFFDPLNTLVQKEYYILNARVSLYDPRTKIRLTLYGKNITDQAFLSQDFYNDFGEVGYYGAGRSYGITLNWSYGN